MKYNEIIKYKLIILMANSEDKSIDLKAILVGESGVGKTNLINTSLGKEFNPNINASPTNSYSKKEFEINKKIYSVDLWDTVGQESYRGITKMLINNSKIVIFVYDITYKKSLEELSEYWLKTVKEELGDKFIGGVVGNKIDLEETAKDIVKEEEGKKFAESNGFKFALVSAKDQPSLFTVFLEELIKQYVGIEDHFENKKRSDSIILKAKINAKKQKSCC